MIGSSEKRSSEIKFQDDFNLEEEKTFMIWNFVKGHTEQYIVKKEAPNVFSLYLSPSKLDNPILKFFGLWKDLTEEEFTIITDSISDIRKEINKRFSK